MESTQFSLLVVSEVEQIQSLGFFGGVQKLGEVNMYIPILSEFEVVRPVKFQEAVRYI